MKRQFSVLTKVNPREHWEKEATDFTPWLAQDENIAFLGEALGLELEVKNIEVAAGPYWADILARDSDGNFVVIENQLGKTNHDHLGKLLTYAAALDAGTVVWIASEFTDEHKKAMDWLNDLVGDAFALYGVKLEVWKIEDSKPAIRFNVVSRPSEVTRSAAIAALSENLSDTRKLQLEFWTEFAKRLKEANVVPSVRSARPQYWFNVPLGRTGIHLSNIANTFENKIGVRVYIRKNVAKVALEHLLHQREKIEQEIGNELLWNPHPDRLDKVIAIYRDADLERRDCWPEYCDWMVEKTRTFKESFSPRIKNLDLTVAEDAEPYT